MRKAFILTALLAFPALAQQTQQRERPTLTASQRAALQKYQAVTDLQTTVSLLVNLDKTKGYAFTKAQAAKLLPVLQDLVKRSNLTPGDATKILTNVEDKILTEKQLAKLDDLALAREEERRQRMQAGGGQRPAGAAGQGQRTGIPNGQRPGGPGGMLAAIQNGTPFNPFKEGRANEQVRALITLLGKR